MVINENNKTLDSTNAFFDDFVQNIDLNEDLKELYQALGNENKIRELEENIVLNKKRNANHKRYHDINISKYEGLPQEFLDITENIFELYNYIDDKNILNSDLYETNNITTLLDNIYRRIDRLDNMVKTYLKQLMKENDEKQVTFSFNNFYRMEIEENLKKEIIDKYNKLAIFSSNISKDPYVEIKRQAERAKYISEILVLLNIEEEKKVTLKRKDKLEILNKELDIQIAKYKEQIQYLEDIMPSDSRHIKEFEEFKDFCNKIIAYDDTNYENAKQTFEILNNDERFKNHVLNFEELFVQEIIDKKNEEVFIYEKIGEKNFRKSLDFIINNYMEFLDDESKDKIDKIINILSTSNYDLKQINELLNSIVSKIWKKEITDVYSFNPNENYCFICTNNQFIDPKYQAILITKEAIKKVNDYDDYQIGFICEYNNNIMYITENDDIMSVSDIDDMSNLKTPRQLEEEFIDFKVCNRIALNGFQTKLQGVYFINDGNIEKKMKAIELANMYNLPLIQLKKDN